MQTYNGNLKVLKIARNRCCQETHVMSMPKNVTRAILMCGSCAHGRIIRVSVLLVEMTRVSCAIFAAANLVR